MKFCQIHFAVAVMPRFYATISSLLVLPTVTHEARIRVWCLVGYRNCFKGDEREHKAGELDHVAYETAMKAEISRAVAEQDADRCLCKFFGI